MGIYFSFIFLTFPSFSFICFKIKKAIHRGGCLCKISLLRILIGGAFSKCATNKSLLVAHCATHKLLGVAHFQNVPPIRVLGVAHFAKCATNKSVQAGPVLWVTH